MSATNSGRSSGSGRPEPEKSNAALREKALALWGDIDARARAGLFFDLLRLAPSDLEPAGADSLDALRRQIGKRISRLESQHTGNQALLESLVPMREWLQGRLSDYIEWVLPCLDYLFISLAGHHGPAVPEPVVSLGLFDFTALTRQHFAEGTAADGDGIDANLDRLLKEVGDKVPADAPLAQQFDVIDLLLQAGTPDEDYLYVDGQGFCETPLQKLARDRALRLVDRCPDVAEHHRRLGFALLILGEFAHALMCFQRQQRHAPRDGVIDNNIAWCQMKLGRFEDAITSAEKAIASAGARPEVHHDYAAVLSSFLQDQPDEAVGVIERALAGSSECGVQLYYLKALLLDRAGRAEAAAAAWIAYLRRAHGRPGHRKAVARAAAALSALGHPYPLARYPVRAIAEETIRRVGTHASEIRDCIKKLGVPPDRIERLEREMAGGGWTDINGLENRCRDLFAESEKILIQASRGPGILESPYLLNIPGNPLASVGPFSNINWEKVKECLHQMRDEREHKCLPYYVLLRDGVIPLLQQIVDHVAPERPHRKGRLGPSWPKLLGANSDLLDQLYPIGGVSWDPVGHITSHLAAVKKVVQLGAWVTCRDLLKQKHGRSLPVEALLRLLASWEDRSHPKTAQAGVRLADIVRTLRDRLPADVLETIERRALRPLHIDSALQTCREQIATAEKSIAIGQEQMGQAKAKQQVEETRLQAQRQEAERQLGVWCDRQQKLDSAGRAADALSAELASAARLKRATGFWAALAGNAERVRQICLKVPQLAEQIARVIGDLLAFPPLSADLEANLHRLKKEAYDWMRAAQARLATGREESSQQTEHLRKAIASCNQMIQECRQVGERQRQQVVTEQQRYADCLGRARQNADALERLKNEIPVHSFFPGKDVVALCMLHNGQPEEPAVCCAGMTDDPIAVYSLRSSGHESLPGHPGGVTSLASAPSGAWIASGGMDGQIKLWSKPSLAVQRSTSLGSAVYSLAFGDDSLFVGLEDKIVVFALPDLTPVTTLVGVEGRVFAVACDVMRRRLYAATADFGAPLYSAVYVWDLPGRGPTSRLRQRLRGFGGPVLCLALDPAGKWLAAGEALGTLGSPEPSQILMWDAQTLRLNNVIAGHDGLVESLAFSPDGRWLVSGDAVGRIQQPAPSRILLHDLASGTLPLAVQAHSGWVRSLAFDTKGNLLFTGGSDGTWVWDFDRLQKLSQITTTFKVKAPTKQGQSVYLVGDSRLLGGWAPEAGVRLSPTDYPIWLVTMSLPASANFQYKYVKRDESGSTIWEEGANRKLSTPAKGEITQEDVFCGN